MIDRRGLLAGIGAALFVPAIVRADRLMRLSVPRRLILWGDGFHDDTDAVRALINGTGPVFYPNGESVVRQFYDASDRILLAREVILQHRHVAPGQVDSRFIRVGNGADWVNLDSFFGGDCVVSSDRWHFANRHLWPRLSQADAIKIERVTGMPRHELRPDLWKPPSEAA